jgi:glucose/arabinose dehydrogenase
MRMLGFLIATAVTFAAGPPNFSGTYLLENSQSKSDFNPVTKMVIGQTANHFAMTQANKNGVAAHNVQGECLTDGIRHAVPEAQDEWITCRWERSVLVTEQTWNGARQRRTTRTQLTEDGSLVQDIQAMGPAGIKSAHLVWAKQLAAHEPQETDSAAKTVMQPDTEELALPEPYSTPSADNSQQIVPAHSEAILHCLEGFEVSMWARGFKVPRFLLQGKGDEILLSDSGVGARSGTVYVFAHGDPARRKALISGLDRPYGMAIWNDYLYVAEAASIKRYLYNASSLTVAPGEQIISLDGMDVGHWTRSLLFDRAGEKLYVGIGSEQNAEAGEDPRRAAINRYNPDGSGHEIYASGLRNPIGLHWYPSSDVLWAAVQERDGLGDDLVPDYLTHIERGAFYGWPYTYLGLHQDPRLTPPSKELLAKIAEPDQLLGAHVAVLDFIFYTGHQFPTEFHGGAFLAYHGSWNRSKRVGYVVEFIPFESGEPSGRGYDFVAGWTDTGSETNVFGRPVAVFQTADGSLLISDDGGGVIWKVSYQAKRDRP